VREQFGEDTNEQIELKMVNVQNQEMEAQMEQLQCELDKLQAY